MTEHVITAEIVLELGRTADQLAGDVTTLVSVTVDMLASGQLKATRAQLTRQTKTLLFLRAEAMDANGTLLATASSVHKITSR
jgi:hypothetical protein